MSIKYAIIGCGLIGKKRLLNLPKNSVKVVCDLNIQRAKDLAALAGPECQVVESPDKAVSESGIDAVIIATLNASLAPLAKKAIKAGKHVLVEKPGAISTAEIKELITLSKEKNVKVRVGFNHRYHPAFQKASEIFKSGELGELMFIRARYGHGARVGYNKEWRADAKLSGGGELMDQGVHVIDLAGWFLGEFTETEGHASTLFWDMPVDDNAFLSLRTKKGQTAWLQVSCTEWKNTFSMEIYGKTAKLHIEGLGGSYGLEKLYFYKMLPEMGPPETTVYEFPREDKSWAIETAEFEKDISLNREPEAGLTQALRALSVVETIYRKSGYLK